ncbi:MAG: 4Fe-4S binding protein [Candidatus Buchananbacteria bacterium]
MAITIDLEKCCWKDGKCTSCGCESGSSCFGCVEVCAMGAITREDIVKVDSAKCIDCGACISACKHGAITL